MGEVYRAWDAHLERAVAIKLIRADRLQSADVQERFRREAQAIAQLDHPAIVRIYHIQKWREHHCIVMELVDGKTLATLLDATGPFAHERAVPLLRKIAEGARRSSQPKNRPPGSQDFKRDGQPRGSSQNP